MSTIEEAIYTRCTVTATGLAVLIGDRCYPNVLPEADSDVLALDENGDASNVAVNQVIELPAVRFVRVSDPDVASVHSDSGAAGMAAPRFQFDCYARTETEAKVVGEALRLAWENFRGVEAGVSIYRAIRADRRDGYEEELDLHRDTLDFIIWHGEPTA